MATHSLFLPGESHGERSLEGYSPWGRKRVGHNWSDLADYTFKISKYLLIKLSFSRLFGENFVNYVSINSYSLLSFPFVSAGYLIYKVLGKMKPCNRKTSVSDTV